MKIISLDHVLSMIQLIAKIARHAINCTKAVIMILFQGGSIPLPLPPSSSAYHLCVAKVPTRLVASQPRIEKPKLDLHERVDPK